MRVLMVTEDVPAAQIGGLGKHAVTLANALLSDGHDVDLLGRSDRGEGDAVAAIGFAGRFIPGFHLKHAAWKEAQVGAFLPMKRPAIARRIARAISRLACDYDIVHYHGHLPMVGSYLPQTINFVQTRHDQGSECLTQLRFVAGEVCNTIVAEDCAKCMHPSPGRLRRLISANAVAGYRELAAATFATRGTIFVSDFLRRQFLRAVPWADMRNTWVVHNFVDFRRLQQHVASATDIEPGSILLAGRIDNAKGFAAFLDESSASLPHGIRLQIVGDGPHKEPLERRYANDRIVFHGWRSYAEVIRATARAHVCVVPSIWEEPCGTTILEALALGRPCVALARGGTPELIEYERYPGQLALVTTMHDLVRKAFEIATRIVERPRLRQGFDADVTAAMRKITAIYAGETANVAAA